MKQEQAATRLSRRFASTFGASYCQIAILSQGVNGSSAVLDSKKSWQESNGDTTTIVAIPVGPVRQHDSEYNVAGQGDQRSNGWGYQSLSVDENVTKIKQACQNDACQLQFAVHQQSGDASQLWGYLSLAFSSPRTFATSEVRALLNMVELAVLILNGWAGEPRQDGWQERKSPAISLPNSDILELPFLEAKKIWIDTFENSYLQQRLAKHSGNISRLAREAKISRYTVYALLDKFQLSAKAFKKSKSRPSVPAGGMADERRLEVPPLVASDVH